SSSSPTTATRSGCRTAPLPGPSASPPPATAPTSRRSRPSRTSAAPSSSSVSAAVSRGSGRRTAPRRAPCWARTSLAPPRTPRAPSLSSGGHFFFLADDLTTGPELWVSDGTAAGTHLVKDVFPGSRSSEISQLTAAGNKVYFVADDGVHGREPWVSDGTGA